VKERWNFGRMEYWVIKETVAPSFIEGEHSVGNKCRRYIIPLIKGKTISFPRPLAKGGGEGFKKRRKQKWLQN
jgi:hypothetical protein